MRSCFIDILSCLLTSSYFPYIHKFICFSFLSLVAKESKISESTLQVYYIKCTCCKKQNHRIYVLGRLCLPQGFKDFDLLEAEADFYQIPPLSAAIQATKQPEQEKPKGGGYYVEVLDFEETAYFYRFYSDPPRGIHTELKNGGLVISGAKEALLTLPLPDKTIKDLDSSDAVYRTINISSTSCSKMEIIHHLQAANWQLVTTSFANNTDNDGSYMVHKYMWYLPT